MKDQPLDDVDRRIIEVLGSDARKSVAALAEAVSISRASAYNRLERLETGGVIKGYTIRVDSRRMGLGLSAVILISFRQGDWRELRSAIAEMPEVEYAVLTTGPCDALLLVRVRDIEALRRFILERIQTRREVRSSQTVLVLDEVVDRPFVMPNDIDM